MWSDKTEGDQQLCEKMTEILNELWEIYYIYYSGSKVL